MNQESKKNSKPSLAGEGVQQNMNHSQCTTDHQNPLNRVLDAIRMQGGTVRSSGSGWICTCPAHDDRNPSLSVREGEDGSVLLKCHAGCSNESVVASLGLSMRDLFVHDTTATITSRRFRSKNAASVSDSTNESLGFATLDEAIAVYEGSLGFHNSRWDYHNEQGDLVGVVLRWDAVNSKQIRPISLIEGQWKLTGMDTPRPLYRLREVRNSTDPNSSDPVLVCEGEKAADAAFALGYAATTSPHGSKSASKADWSTLAGRDLIIIPDLDEAGDAYADDVMGFCKDATSIRVVDLSEVWKDLEQGADLADVLELEAGDVDTVRSKLDALIERTQPEEPTKNSEKSVKTFQKFPVELLPEPVRSYIVQGAEAIGCDPSYIALPVLSMLAGAIGNTHEVRLNDDWVEPCIVWTCIVGRSGTAKSPAIDLAFKPLTNIQERLFLEHHRALQEYSKDSDVPPPISQRCIVDDATIEALYQCIQENPRGLVQKRDELSGWFDFDRYSAGKGVGSAARWIELFHGRSASVDRRTSESIFVSRAALNVAGGIQPGVLSRVFDRKNLESGLVARFLFAMPDPRAKKWTRATITQSTKRQMYDLVEQLFDHKMCNVQPDASEAQPKPHVIGLTDSAIRAFAAFADQHNESSLNQTEHIASAWAKLEGYVARIALIIHLIREAMEDCTLGDPERIDLKSMNDAIGVIVWFKTEISRLYEHLGMSQEQRETQLVINWIDKQGGAVTVRDFSRGLKKYNDAKVAKQKLIELEQAGIGYFRGKQPYGRTQEFVLNPEYTTRTYSTVTATSATEAAKKAHIDSGASGRYPVQSTRKDQ